MNATARIKKAGFVYLIRAENGLTKIGRSLDPPRRLIDLDISAVEIELLHQIQTDDMVWLEGYLHGRYDACHKRKEWFDLTTEDISELLAVKQWNRPADWVPEPRRIEGHPYAIHIPSILWNHLCEESKRTSRPIRQIMIETIQQHYSIEDSELPAQKRLGRRPKKDPES